jgi:pSer/pThr/pTyr-binding forkhead associated (FHA) protein
VLVETVEHEVTTDGEPVNIPPNTFLIVNGSRIFPLDQTVVNIGRRSTNDLVVDDHRVSRDHAQLRAVRGKYILFDLSSTGGTFVNGQRVNQKTLNPLDVISLAGVALVYGQEMIDAQGLGQTEKMSTLDQDDDLTTTGSTI